MAYTYRWSDPFAWLEEKLADADHEETLRVCRELLSKMDNDTLQDLFQDEMDEDGYFQKIRTA